MPLPSAARPPSCKPGGLALVVLLSLAPSCYHVTYSNGVGHPYGSQSGTNHFFLWGLANTAEVEVNALCPEGLARLVVGQSFLDGFLRLLTFGIYTPRSWEAWCMAEVAPSQKAEATSGPLPPSAVPPETVRSEPAPAAHPAKAHAKGGHGKRRVSP